MGSEVNQFNTVMVAAHELKAPLSSLRQLAFALQSTDQPAERESLCEQMIDLSDRALLQINDLAKVARLEGGLFAMEPVSVRGVCEAVAHDLRPFCQSEGKNLQFRYHNRQKLAIANPELLYSIVYNFCTNAAYCSGLETSSLVTVKDSRETIQIAVRDFGPALPNQIWRQIQSGTIEAALPISMRPGSSSLGLYISAKFAHYMRARLHAVRHRDGTSFYIDLPVSGQACLFGAF